MALSQTEKHLITTELTNALKKIILIPTMTRYDHSISNILFCIHKGTASV